MCTWTITTVIVAHSHVRARAIYVRFEPTRDRDREIRKIDRQNQRRERALLVPASPSIFQIRFPETGWSHENAPTRTETVLTCPALPTYN